MFCTHCGAGEQSTGAYCKRCGKWLGASAPEQRMMVMMIFSAISAVFGAASAIALFATYYGTKDVKPAVYVAATFCTIISVYQLINLIFTLGLFQRRKQGQAENQHADTSSEAELEGRVDYSAPVLRAADTAGFIRSPSVVEGTTELLEPVPRVAPRDHSQ